VTMPDSIIQEEGTLYRLMHHGLVSGCAVINDVVVWTAYPSEWAEGLTTKQMMAEAHRRHVTVWLNGRRLSS